MQKNNNDNMKRCLNTKKIKKKLSNDVSNFYVKICMKNIKNLQQGLKNVMIYCAS